MLEHVQNTIQVLRAQGRQEAGENFLPFLFGKVSLGEHVELARKHFVRHLAVPSGMEHLVSQASGYCERSWLRLCTAEALSLNEEATTRYILRAEL